MAIRRLTSSDSTSYQALRLAALRDSPSAFGSSYEEEKDFPPSIIEGRLAVKPDGGIFGAFEGTSLVGLVALVRDKGRKREHKALILSMYVTPTARGKGTGRALLMEALALARSVACNPASEPWRHRRQHGSDSSV
jgi:GNAT superfamily N-acetyltransferase